MDQPVNTNGWNWGAPQFPNNQPTAMQQRGITGVLEVTDDDQVNRCQVAAGQTVLIINFLTKKFWLKASDVYGRSLPAVPYIFEDAPQPVAEKSSQYASKEDFDKLSEKINTLIKSLS